MKKQKKKIAPHTRRKARPRGKPFQKGNTAGHKAWFPPGMSGNPDGRPKYAVASQAARAVLAAPIPDDPEGRLFAEGIAQRLAWMALAGDRAAAELLFDRAEGRPHQSVHIDENRQDPLQDLLDEFKRAHENACNATKEEG